MTITVQKVKKGEKMVIGVSAKLTIDGVEMSSPSVTIEDGALDGDSV
jgi:hypothetical protein